jgi:UDP-2,3-diacylglucosamine pyrophosphatase LpxH
MASYIKGFDSGYETASVDVVEVKTIQSKSLVPKSHLEKLSSMTGEYAIRKRGMELERLELAKLMREATPAILLTEAYKEYLEQYETPFPESFKYLRGNKQGKSVIKSLLSDYHIGAEIDEEYNQFNYKVATERVKKYTDKILQTAELYNAHTISVTLMGDMIEGFTMRDTQKWECEFNASAQIVKAQEIVLMHIESLLKAGYNVHLSGVYGNHDRITGDKNKSIEEDNAVFIIIENIKNLYKWIEKYTGAMNEKLTIEQFIDGEYKYHVDEYYGFRTRYQHGDEDGSGDNVKIEKYNGVDNDSYDCIVFGHLHHGRVIHRNRNTYELYCGSIMGSNEYGKNRVKSLSDASQALIVIFENGETLPIHVNLQ